jgi:hypothetical protein
MASRKITRLVELHCLCEILSEKAFAPSIVTMIWLVSGIQAASISAGEAGAEVRLALLWRQVFLVCGGISNSNCEGRDSTSKDES